MIRIVLEALRKEGKLEVLGTGHGVKWRKRDNKLDNKWGANKHMPWSIRRAGNQVITVNIGNKLGNWG